MKRTSINHLGQMKLCRMDRRRLIRKGLHQSELSTVNNESGSWFTDYLKKKPELVTHKKEIK